MKLYVAANNNYMALSAFKRGEGIRSLKQCIQSRTGRQHIYSMVVQVAVYGSDLAFTASRPLPTESQAGGILSPSRKSTSRPSMSEQALSASLDDIARAQGLDPEVVRKAAIKGIVKSIEQLKLEQHTKAHASARAYVDTPRGKRYIKRKPYGAR